MKAFKIALILVLCCGIGYASITHDFTFSLSDFSFSKEGEYDFITYSDCYYTREVGNPCLPVIVANLVIPLDRKISGFSIDSSKYEELEGSYYIYPSQPYLPLNYQTEWSFVPPNIEVYESPDPYPGELVKVSGLEYSGGAKVASVVINPFQYIPKDKKLLFYNHIKVTFDLSSSEDKSLSVHRRTQEQHDRYIKKIESMVINPEDVNGYICKPLIVDPQELGDSLWTFVIITSQDIESLFSPLAEWRVKQGMKTKIVSVEWIGSIYNGCDLQEKIKSFIQGVYSDKGTEYILMGGDGNYVPCRIVTLCLGTFPTDLYYTGLDGNWNADGDDYYGEFLDDEDEVDLSPDLWIGRAKVSTPDEASIFVDKILTYEKNPPTYDGDRDFLLMGAALFVDDETYEPWGGGDAKEYLAQNISTPPTKYRMYDLYYGHYPSGQDMDRLIGKIPAIDHLNQGYYLINHLGHGGYIGFSVGPTLDHIYSDIIYSRDLDNLQNGTKYGVIFSAACKTAAFDKGLDSCFAQHYLVNPNKGGVAYIGCSDESWGAIPVWVGPSSKLDNIFFWNRCGCAAKHVPKAIYSKIGEAWGMAVTIYDWEVDGSKGYHQVMTTNLLGDPTMHVWIEEPLPLTVTHPDTILPDETVDFTVYVTSNSAPVSNALVCLYMPSDEIYEKEFTNASGEATFTITPTNEGDLYVTVTKRDYLPYTGITKVELIPPKLWGMLSANGAVFAHLHWSWDPGAYYLDHYELFRNPDVIYSGTNTSYKDPLPFAPGEMRRYHVDAWYRKVPGGELYLITSNTVTLQREGLFLYTYDGSEMIEDNNILVGAHEGVDGFDFYKLRYLPVEYNGIYHLELREFADEHSFIDMVRLFAINHLTDVNIEVVREDIILPYRDVLEPIYCLDQNGVDWTDLVTNGGYFEGFDGDTLIINFGEIDAGIYIFLPVASPQSESIEISKYEPGTGWEAINMIYPRDHPSVTPVIVNHSLSDSLLIRLIWHDHHRLEYAGLARVGNEQFHVMPCQLLSAVHSETGSIMQKLLFDDEDYVELLPGDTVSLDIAIVGAAPGWVQDFVFVSNGYHVTEEDGGSQTTYENIPVVHSLSVCPIPAKNDISITFGIPRDEMISIKVYDISGREVNSLVDKRLKAGYHIIRLDDIDLPSGIYFARLVTDNYEETKKLVVMK